VCSETLNAPVVPYVPILWLCFFSFFTGFVVYQTNSTQLLSIYVTLARSHNSQYREEERN